MMVRLDGPVLADHPGYVLRVASALVRLVMA
jgi:hypothetical protein